MLALVRGLPALRELESLYARGLEKGGVMDIAADLQDCTQHAFALLWAIYAMFLSTGDHEKH